MMQIVTLLLILASGYLWLTLGFFSALLNLMCAIAAGAIAFGVWEPLSLLLLNNAGDRGFFNELLAGSAWALGLAVPFAVSMALLRLAVDSLLKYNVHLSVAVNYGGGALCGAASGLIVAGIITMSVGAMRLPTDMGFLAYNPAAFADLGSVKRGDSQIIPADRIVARLYKHLSGHTLSTSTPLAEWYADLEMVPGTLRLSAGDGAARNTIRPKDFNLVGDYTVTGTLDQLTGPDRWNPDKQSGVQDVDGNNLPQGSQILGYVINFLASAKEKNGSVMISNGHIRLFGELEDGAVRDYYPFAVIGRRPVQNTDSDPAAAARRGPVEKFGRYRFDSKGTIIPSVGGEADALFGFEFLVPKGFTPRALYVRNVRVPIDAPPKRKFAGVAMRDSQVDSIMEGKAAAPDDESKAFRVGRGGTRPVTEAPPDSGLSFSNNLGLVLQRDTVGPSMDVVPAPRSGNMIRDGFGEYDPRELKQVSEAQLRVDKLEPADDITVVQLDVGVDTPWTIAGRGLSLEGMAPVLIDADGARYPAVGYIYRDPDRVSIRYTPGRPMAGLGELPQQLSRSIAGQNLKLVFRVTRGATITGFAVGNQVLAKYAPPITVNVAQ